ncbi:MAG TPA: SRPBCC family protein [Pyrinomonadaceae bacterium]|jgi:ribosome-associated toxin RatA of RatAB toxin-antitoxin module
MKTVRWAGAWLIRAPRNEVYALMTDFERWPETLPGIVEQARVISRTDTAVVLEGDFNLQIDK